MTTSLLGLSKRLTGRVDTPTRQSGHTSDRI